MPTLDRDGVAISYSVYRGGASATTILLSHGFAATAEMWHHNIPALSARHRVVTWDLRGHGHSASPDRPDLYTQALSREDMRALLDEVDAPRAVLVGHSLGGYLSLAFTRKYPDRVAGLVLVDTGPGFRRDEARDEFNKWAEARAAAFEQRGLDALGDSSEERAANHRDARGLALAARGIMTQHGADIIDWLPNLSVPTLVVVGAEDRLFVGVSEYLTAKIPGAARVVIEAAGHAPNIDDPEHFNEVALTFLDSLTSPR